MLMAGIRTWRIIVGANVLHSRGSSNAATDAAPARLRARRTGCRGR